MKKTVWLTLFMIIILVALPFNSFSNPLQTELQSSEEVENNLKEMTEEEKDILENLFILLQEIFEMEEKERIASTQIEDLKENIENIEISIENESRKYDENLNLMEEVLKEYQRNGASSFLELILSSDSLNILLKRLNAIRDILRNTNNLLESIELSKTRLIEERENIANMLNLMEEKQRELKESLEMKLKLRDDLELRLSKLQDERLKYEEYLKAIENSFNEFKPVFTETIDTLVRKIEEGIMPEEAISLSLSFPNIKGSINEENFNSILKTIELPAKLEVNFSEDKMVLLIPDIFIQMSGNLEVLDDHVLIFRVQEGSFMGLSLEESTIEELFKGGYLELNFRKLLGKNKINSVKILDKKIELLITPVLF